jgi:hypothetical protein
MGELGRKQTLSTGNAGKIECRGKAWGKYAHKNYYKSRGTDCFVRLMAFQAHLCNGRKRQRKTSRQREKNKKIKRKRQTGKKREANKERET